MIERLLFVAGSHLWELHALADSHRDESVRRAAKAVAAIPTDSKPDPSLLISHVKLCLNSCGKAITAAMVPAADCLSLLVWLLRPLWKRQSRQRSLQDQMLCPSKQEHVQVSNR